MSSEVTLRISLHAPDRRRLQALIDSPVLRRDELPWLGGMPPFERLCFGVEFCQHLLPSPDDVAAAVAVCRDRGLGFTLVTPYVTDEGLERVMRLVEAGGDAPDLEVLVSDWGVLHELQRRGLPGRPVLGRLLNRMMRDPRIPEVGSEHLGGDAPPVSWRQASVGSSAFRSLLTDLGVQRVASDVPLQGLLPLPEGGPRVTAWLPFGMAVSGRICLVHALGRPAAGRFVPPRSCDAPCRRYEAELQPPWTLPRADSGGEARFLLKGNTHFYRLAGEDLDRALEWAHTSPPVDRIVACPDLPM